MAFNPKIPYNELPPLPPPADIESSEILKKAISAGRALAELKGAVTNLPNPALFIDTINLQEAQASSAIENIITTQDELFKSSIAKMKIENPAVKEVIHYKNALWYGVERIKARPMLTTNLFIEIMQIIVENRSNIRNTLGTRLENPVTGRVLYTPPEGETLIRDKLKNLEDFIHAEDGIDPLVKMAIVHYQFEAIHPFFDGNGRTGRIILVLYLIMSGLLDLPVLYLSEHIIKHKGDYYTCLREVTEHHDWKGLILFMLDMVERSAITGRRRIVGIKRLMKETEESIRVKVPRIASKNLVDVLFALPYTKRSFLVKAGLGNLKTVGVYLKELEAAGLLKSEQVGKEKLYLNVRLMNLLKKE